MHSERRGRGGRGEHWSLSCNKGKRAPLTQSEPGLKRHQRHRKNIYSLICCTHQRKALLYFVVLTVYNDNKLIQINSIQFNLHDAITQRRLYGLKAAIGKSLFRCCRGAFSKAANNRCSCVFVVCASDEKRRQPRSTSGPLRRRTAGSAQASAHFPHAVFNVLVSIRHRGEKKRQQWRKQRAKTGGSISLFYGDK